MLDRNTCTINAREEIQLCWIHYNSVHGCIYIIILILDIVIANKKGQSRSYFSLIL